MVFDTCRASFTNNPVLQQLRLRIRGIWYLVLVDCWMIGWRGLILRGDLLIAVGCLLWFVLSFLLLFRPVALCQGIY